MPKGKNNKRRPKNVNVYGVYTVKTYENENAIKIKQLGLLDSTTTKKPADTRLEKTLTIKDNVMGYFFNCNITNNFLVQTKKLPVMYMFLEYNYKNLLRSELFRIFLYFTIEDDIKNEKQLIREKLNGKYTMEILLEDNLEEINTIDQFTSSEDMIEQILTFVQSEEIIEVIDDMVKEKDKLRLEEYGNRFQNIKIPKPTITIKSKEYD